MSFPRETKAELCREKLSHLSASRRKAYGVLLFCNVYTPNEVRITTRSLDFFAQRRLKLFHRAFEVTFDQTPEASGRGAFVCSDPEQIAPDDGRLRRQTPKACSSTTSTYGVLRNRAPKRPFCEALSWPAGPSPTLKSATIWS